MEKISASNYDINVFVTECFVFFNIILNCVQIQERTETTEEFYWNQWITTDIYIYISLSTTCSSSPVAHLFFPPQVCVASTWLTGTGAARAPSGRRGTAALALTSTPASPTPATPAYAAPIQAASPSSAAAPAPLAWRVTERSAMMSTRWGMPGCRDTCRAWLAGHLVCWCRRQSTLAYRSKVLLHRFRKLHFVFVYLFYLFLPVFFLGGEERISVKTVLVQVLLWSRVPSLFPIFIF